MKNKQEKQLSKGNYTKIFYVFIFLCITLIAYFFPYTHDDWSWGSTDGIIRLNSLFADYNGRWAGNLLVIFLTRFRFIRAVFISTTFLGIIYFIKKLINTSSESNLLAIILFLGMPISVLAQSVAWTAGFANYVLPILIILIYLYFNKNIFSNEKVDIKNKWSVPFLLLGFLNSLFIEHITIYNLLLSIGVLVYFVIRKEKISLSNIFYVIGSLLGTILMFSNGAYYNIANSNDDYRTIEQANIFTKAFKTYFNELYNFLINNNVLLNIVLCILLLLLIYNFYKKNKKSITLFSDIILKFSMFIVCGFLSYIVYSNIIDGANIFIYPLYKKILEGIMMIFFAIAVVAIVLITIKDKSRKTRILFYISSIIIIALPLLIVTPIGPRCFFPTYVFFVMICCELFDLLVTDKIYIFKQIFSFLVVFLIICMFSIYGYVFKVDSERINYIDLHKNDAIIILPKIPFENYMHVPNPRSEIFISRFKEFYGINEDSELKFIDYKSWKRELDK